MTPSEQRFIRAMLVSAAVLIAAWATDVWLIPIRVLTRYDGHEPLSPLYAFWIPALSWRLLGPAFTHSAYLLWVWCSARWWSAAAASRWLVPAHVCWFGVLAVSLAAIRLPWDGLGRSMEVYPGEEFWDDVPKVGTPGEFLARFTDMQSRRGLSLHGLAHPPGHTLFLWSVATLIGGGTHAAALAILAAGCSSLWPIHMLVRRLFGARVAERVVVLFPLVPSISMYAISATDFLFLAAASWSMWAAVTAVLGRGAWMALAAGIAAAAAAMFSFAHGFIGMIVGLWAISIWVTGAATAAPRQLAGMAAGLSAGYAVIRWGLGYDWIESLALTNRFHRYVIAVEIGRLTPAMWLYTSAGNLLAFSWYLGIPTVAGAALGLRDAFRSGLWSGGTDRQLLRSVGLILALMVAGGLFLLEVERIWLYMVAPLLAAACQALPCDVTADRERRWRIGCAAVMAFQCIANETILFTLW